MADSKAAHLPLQILVVDDEESIRFAISVCLEQDGHNVSSARNIREALDQTARVAFDLIFLDVRLGMDNGLDYIKALLHENPWARVIVITAYASIETAVEAMKRGAADYLAKPFEPAQLTLLTQKVAERRALERKVEALQRSLGSLDPEADFPTSSPIWRESIELARRVASANSPVLICGEAGTGRGRLARAIHQWSPRAAGPFASIAFDGMSDDEAEAQLFGGASELSSEIGAIAFAHRGTLLIDGIENLPMRLQHKLLSVVREREFERQDQYARRPADVRMIATTSADLRRLVEMGKFRADLLLAFNIVQIDIPPLRDRPEDILLLAERYLAFFAREHHKPITGFSRDAMFVLKAHQWPGNSRELKNVIERAVLACDSPLAGLPHLPVDLMQATSAGRELAERPYQVGDLVPLEVIKEAHIRQVLASAKTLRRAAAVLGIDPSSLCRRLKRTKTAANHDEPA